MIYVEIALLVLGLGLLIVGYNKNNRNMLAASTLILLLGAGIESFVPGFVDGYKTAAEERTL